MADFNPQEGAEKPGYERRDTDTVAVSWILGIVLGSTALVMLIVVGLFGWFYRALPRPWVPAPELQSARQDFPQPQLQVSPPLDMAALNARFKEELTQYGWVDRARGKVRIPVQRALEITAERGLPETTRKLTPLELRQERAMQPGADRSDRSALRLVKATPTPSALGTEEIRAITFDQHLGASIPRDLQFRDESGRNVQLGDYLGSTPIVLVLGYYRCPMLCTLVANGLVESLQDQRFNVGREFQVLHVSIDPSETPTLAAAKKATYVRQYGRRGAEPGWHLLTGSGKASAQLAEVVGFKYRYDPKTREYAHPSGVVILTPSGQVSRYFFGVNFPANELRLALVEASGNQIGSPTDKLLLLCYHLMPITGQYGTAILWVIRGAGALSFLALVAGVVWMLRRERRQKEEA